MEKKDILTKVLAGVGTMLTWLPVVAPFLLSVIALLQSGVLRFDYLMPAELFAITLVGAALLLWSALRIQSHQYLIGGSVLLAAILLIGTQALAVVTGLAHGETEPGGWEWNLVLVGLAAFWLSLLSICYGSILVCRHVFARRVSA